MHTTVSDADDFDAPEVPAAAVAKPKSRKSSWPWWAYLGGCALIVLDLFLHGKL